MPDIAAIARVCHEVNRTLCQSQGDDSQVPWDDAPEWQRNSAMAGVRVKLENPDMTPELQHNAWCLYKLADGWRYGPVENEEAKRHPCMVDYEDLPESQRLKNHLFGAVVLAMKGGE